MKGLINKFSILFFIIILLYVIFPNLFSNNTNTIFRRIIEIVLIIIYTKFNIYYGLAMCLFILFIKFRHSYRETFGIDNDVKTFSIDKDVKKAQEEAALKRAQEDAAKADVKTFGIDKDFIKDEIARQLKDKVGPTGERGAEGKQGPEGRQGARGEPGLDLTNQPQ
jgi:hypothetical protein